MILENLKNVKLVLASASPRRQNFLREMNLDFVVRLLEIEEIYPENLQGSEITDFLAKLKANAFDIGKNELLITSDTIVWQNNKALGKPKDRADAIQTLEALSGSSHLVITSVCFKDAQRTEVINETTEVTFAALDRQMIEYYLKTSKPFDKAGSYGIQDWIGLVGIESIKGSYTNVVGLPTAKVFDFLKNFNFPQL